MLEWMPVVAGVLLLGAGLAVMAPCELQMAATLDAVLRRRAEVTSRGVRAAAARFTAGYLAFYVPVAVALGAVAHLLAGGAWVLAVAGGAGALVLGSRRSAATCRAGWRRAAARSTCCAPAAPRSPIRSGPASPSASTARPAAGRTSTRSSCSPARRTARGRARRW